MDNFIAIIFKNKITALHFKKIFSKIHRDLMKINNLKKCKNKKQKKKPSKVILLYKYM